MCEVCVCAILMLEIYTFLANTLQAFTSLTILKTKLKPPCVSANNFQFKCAIMNHGM